MDISRPELAQRRHRKRLILGTLTIATVASAFTMVARLEPAVPTLERDAVWVSTVERGEILRQVRGNGTLIPEKVLVVPTEVGGRVVRINVLPGALVQADTVLLELSNPSLKQEAFDLEWQLKGSEATLRQLEVRLDEARLALESGIAKLESEHNIAKLEAAADFKLEKDGLVPELIMKRSQAHANDLVSQLALEKKRLSISANSAEAQLAVQASEITKLEAALKLKNEEVAQLEVRAGIEGVVQQIGVTANQTLEVGERVSPGSVLAKIVQPSKLMAQVRIAETQAKDVLIGQYATIDTRNGEIPGKVSRVDPSVVNGTVTVDIKLTGALPKGARPDLSIDGVIELERLPDVIYVGRPVHGQEDTTVGIFKLVEKGYAVRVPVALGRSSISTIEVKQGLLPNDQVILSDMSSHDAHDRVRLR